MTTKHILCSFLFFLASIVFANDEYLIIEAKKGESIQILFNKWGIPYTKENLLKFKELNLKKVRGEKIFWGIRYKLPILIYSKDYFEKVVLPELNAELKHAVLNYNKEISEKGLFSIEERILVPFSLLLKTKNPTLTKNSKNDGHLLKIVRNSTTAKDDSHVSKSKMVKPYYGKKFSKIKYIDNSLKGYAFYLVSGHGGPDPGAIGRYKGYEMDEDEYAYDITLRLSLELERRRAKVFMITLDTNDGIRNSEYLKSGNDELFYGGVQIPLDQKERLQTCANIVNKLYKKNRDKYKKHISVNIHLDSRGQTEKIDVFFYYQEQNLESKVIADFLYETLRSQYEKHQPGRGYTGTVSTRNLFMLRNTMPPTIYIELGNIQNPHNQVRFIKNSNRQAIAKWLALGFIRYCQKSK